MNCLQPDPKKAQTHRRKQFQPQKTATKLHLPKLKQTFQANNAMQLSTITLSLLALATIFATAATLREYLSKAQGVKISV